MGGNAHPCSPAVTSLVVPTLDLVQRETYKFFKEQTNKCCEALTSRLPRFRIQGSQAMYKRVTAALLRNWRFCVGAPSPTFSDNSVQVFNITWKRIAFPRCKSEVNCKPHVAAIHFPIMTDLHQRDCPTLDGWRLLKVYRVVGWWAYLAHLLCCVHRSRPKWTNSIVCSRSVSTEFTSRFCSWRKRKICRHQRSKLCSGRVSQIALFFFDLAPVALRWNSQNLFFLTQWRQAPSLQIVFGNESCSHLCGFVSESTHGFQDCIAHTSANRCSVRCRVAMMGVTPLSRNWKVSISFEETGAIWRRWLASKMFKKS